MCRASSWIAGSSFAITLKVEGRSPKKEYVGRAVQRESIVWKTDSGLKGEILCGKTMSASSVSGSGRVYA